MASSNENDVSSTLRPGDTPNDEIQEQINNESISEKHDIDSRRETNKQKGLRDTIENEIIPRLVLAHNQLTPHRRGFHSLGSEEHHASVLRVADFSLSGNQLALREWVDQLLNESISLEELFLDILAPAAAVLGEKWEKDDIDFVEVSLAVGTLQSLLHELSDKYQHEAASFASDRRVLIISTPGEQHTFGVSMVAEVFRRRGWYVDSSPISNLEALVQHVQSEWFDVAGLSLSAESSLPSLVEGIRQIRRASRNQRIGILVGGPAFNLHPDWLTKVGADALGHDAIQAEEQAHRLIGLLVQGPG